MGAHSIEPTYRPLRALNTLQRHLADNALRRRHQAILAEFEGDLLSTLTAAECLMSEHIEALVEQWHWPDAALTPAVGAGRPSQWQQFSFDTLDALIQHAGRVQMPATMGQLWLDRDAPLLRLGCDVWNDHSLSILGFTRRLPNVWLALVTEDQSRGILVNEHVGRLPETQRTNDREIVYELATW